MKPLPLKRRSNGNGKLCALAVYQPMPQEVYVAEDFIPKDLRRWS
jgi:hypothetical protein